MRYQDLPEKVVRPLKDSYKAAMVSEHFRPPPGQAPDQEPAGQEPVSDLEDAFMQNVRGIVEAHYADEDFGLPQLCLKIGMSRSQLFRKMTALVNTSPSDFIRSYRLNKAKILLEITDLTVSEVVWKVGYKYLAHFSKPFRYA